MAEKMLSYRERENNCGIFLSKAWGERQRSKLTKQLKQGKKNEIKSKEPTV